MRGTHHAYFFSATSTCPQCQSEKSRAVAKRTIARGESISNPVGIFSRMTVVGDVSRGDASKARRQSARILGQRQSRSARHECCGSHT